ncbi:MAG: DUF2378 family protein [Candidatus Doudnabacteria bacterium]|nr:DUF2378 family protein [Candidatus Doudnabacteria bacterium]
METKKPTIKGMFVNSHLKTLVKAKGKWALLALQKAYGKPLKFSNLQDVPVREEIKIIEHCLDLTAKKPVPPEARSYEAGRLHFTNFVTTPFANILFSQFKKQFKMLMMLSGKIAGHVFNGVEFESQDTGSTSVKVTMKNNDYPIDHFRGFFQEWMNYSGLVGEVKAKEAAPNIFEYEIAWKK